MSLLGLLLCGLGLGYAVHKDNQKFANMKREATQLYGRGINESIDDMAIANKYFWEIKKYFDERYDYYINNKDYIINHTNITEVNRPDITSEHLQQHYAGFLAYDDMFRKYAPDYVELYGISCGEPDSSVAFSNIARALARKELYRLGFCPSHMANMNCRLDGKNLYFYSGAGSFGRLGPSAYGTVNWDVNKYKYHRYGIISDMPYCKRK